MKENRFNLFSDKDMSYEAGVLINNMLPRDIDELFGFQLDRPNLRINFSVQKIENDEIYSYRCEDSLKHLIKDLLGWEMSNGLGNFTKVEVSRADSVNSISKYSLQKELSEHKGWIWSVAVSFCGRFIASASQDTTIKVWKNSGEAIHTLAGHSGEVISVSFAPSGELLVSGSYDRTGKVWSTETGECLVNLTGHKDYLLSTVFSNTGSLIASCLLYTSPSPRDS